MRARRQSGFAMLIVLLTLMALLVLCTPFLMTVRNADVASVQGADRMSLELSLDAAGRVADARLGASHSAVDPTPDYDSLAELAVSNDFGEGDFWNASDPRAAMFDLSVHDVSGRIDLNSAPPQLLGNMMGATALTVSTVSPDDGDMPLTSAKGFSDQGFVWVAGELVGYTGKDGNSLTGLLRALGVELDDEGKVPACGPRPARALSANTVVIDQRAWALAQWRSWSGDGVFRRLDAIEGLAQVLPLVMAEDLGEEAYEAFARGGTVYAAVGGGRDWQHPSRVRNQLVAGMDCTLQIHDGRYFNVGTTVRLTDGETTELGIVRRVGGGSITLVDPVMSDYSAFTAVVQPLARRPVNINTASVEVLEALLLHLNLRGRQSRITPREVDDLVEVITQSRPFTSFEDFVRRIILPAGGWHTLPGDAPVIPELFAVEEGLEGGEAAASIQIIDEDDARALYKNALNANDGELGFSTMPFAFTSTDTHHMELRAAVNAPSGVERARGVREQVQNVVPQQDLMFVATRQEDFEQLFRLDREAPGWATGPWATSRHDGRYGSSPPTRSRPHLARWDSMPSDDPTTDEVDYVFAERDPELDDGFAMPWVSREEEVGRRVGRMIHFDNESRELEGRYLPDRPVLGAASDGHIQWLTGDGLMRPFHFSMWVKPEELEEAAMFLDCGGSYSDSDRVSLLIEDGYLVLRVLDGSSDHPDTSFEEVAEARYPLDPGAGEGGPGMPVDTWMHVSVDVRGNRPDQITLLVDGRWHAEQPGLTRLTNSLGDNDAVITVESTEGFPERCVLRIGNELIEAVVSGDTTFTALYESEGEGAGFGGRLARVEFTGVQFETEVPTELFTAVNYDAGTPVELYGYSLLIDGNVSDGQASLGSDLGTFAVGRVIGMEDDGALDGEQNIVLQLIDGTLFTIGSGMELHDEAVLQLAPADPDMETEQLMSAFNPNGGYAVLMSVSSSFTIADPTGTSGSTTTSTTANGSDVGGIEVIHYSSWEDDLLTIDRRGPSITLPNLQDAPEYIEKKAWVFDWSDGLTIGGTGGSPDGNLIWQTKIFPISIGVSNAGSLMPLSSEESNSDENPRFAQITRLGAESGETEWVRYDYNTGDELVRDDPDALAAAWFAIQSGRTEEDSDGTAGPGPGSEPGGGPPSPSGLVIPDPAPTPAPSPPPPTSPSASAVDGPQWHYRMGEREYGVEDYPITLAVSSHFQFRGVMGTFDHPHDQGAVVLPTWKVFDNGVDPGRVGRFDAVMLIDSLPSDPGFPGVVHHAHRPLEYTRYHWTLDPADPLIPALDAGATDSVAFSTLPNRAWIGLEDVMDIPVAGGSSVVAEGDEWYDSRAYTRVSKFPSGELPRTVTTVSVGGGYASNSGVPAATVDELYFGNTDFTGGDDLHGAQMVLVAPLEEEGDAFDVAPNTVRVPIGLYTEQNAQFLSGWPSDGGLVRIGDEVLCYQGYDADTGVVAIAENGRGMLGTDPQPHAAGEPISILQHIPVSILNAGVAAEDAYLQLASLDEFPGSGLLWIEDELIHYTWQDGGALSMPRASSEPGAMDREGAGLFRGRFGTTPTAHGTGIPVVLHPFRFWDRWAEEADAPEMHYLGASYSQPAAFWRTTFFDVEDVGVDGPRLGVLLRTDDEVPWDADPAGESELDLLYDGLRDGKGVPIGAQADRIEWRVFVQWDPGSYDPVDGLLHGWKMAPRLRFLGAEFLAPSRMLRRVTK